MLVRRRRGEQLLLEQALDVPRVRGHFYYQGLRFFLVSWCALAANLLVLRALVALGLDEIAAQAIAIIVVTPVNFLGNKLWSFRAH